MPTRIFRSAADPEQPASHPPCSSKHRSADVRCSGAPQIEPEYIAPQDLAARVGDRIVPDPGIPAADTGTGTADIYSAGCGFCEPDRAICGAGVMPDVRIGPSAASTPRSPGAGAWPISRSM